MLKRLKNHPGIYVFKKEAAAIRGIADIIGCFQGRFFAWELKSCEAKARLNTGSIVLQRYELEKVRAAGGIGEIVYPENFEEKFEELISSS